MSNAIALTLATIYARTEEVGDCREWLGRYVNGCPAVRSERHEVMVRRKVWELKNHRPVPKGNIVWANCRNPRCVWEGHVVLTTTAQRAQEAAKQGAFSTIERRMAIARGQRASRAKLTIEQVQAIRISGDTGPVEAAKHGIHRSLVARIRAGKAWALAGRTAFSGLLP